MTSVRRAVGAFALAGAATACAVGPDFHQPDAPATKRYTTTPLPPETASAAVPGGESQKFVEGRDVPAAWWGLFECDALDALVKQALADSPVVAQVQAKLTRAQQDLVAHRGATQIPKIDANVEANRIDVSSGSFENAPAVPVQIFPLTLYTATVKVSYTLDLAGKSRRELEALQAGVDYEQFEMEAARLMLAGNVVAAAIEEASLREQIASTEEMIALEERTLGIVERLEQIGGVATADVVAHRGELARTRATLPSLNARLERTRHRLAVYLGQPPGEAQLAEIKLAELHIPAELPVSLPSDLARQRPDIRAAEAMLHEASARVGVATANLYPQITLTATAGSLTTAIGSLLSSGTGFALLGATLAQPLFHGGELRAEKRAAVAAYEQAGGAYREVVLDGLRDVADTLCALDADAKVLHERAEAAGAAKTSYEISSKRYEAGGVSLLDLLDAERQLHAASLDRTRAVADRYSDSAALFQALGGGWWSAPPVPSAR
jgi:NodT family efflux transporter outer membrane factor (OMF) lipoprotein